MKTYQTHAKSIEPRKTALSFWLTFAIGLLGGSSVCAAPPIEIPNTPIQTGVRVPANVLLILDDSGSMADVTPDIRAIPHLCGGAATNADIPCVRYSSGTTELTTAEYTALPYTLQISNTVENSTNAVNPLYYSPYKKYNAWRQADGTYRTDHADFTDVFNDPTQAVDGTTPTLNLLTNVL